MVYLLKIVIFRGKLLVITRWYFKHHVSQARGTPTVTDHPCSSPPCQVRVVRFYQSCSLLLLLLLLLLHHLCLHFHVHFRLAKLFANFRTQWTLLDLNCKGLSALGTTGPQPGTFRAQWAPLDLNLRPSELSEHRWTSTSTWDLPSSVSTAGPQRPDRMPEDMPDRTPDSLQIEIQKICQIKCQKI